MPLKKPEPPQHVVIPLETLLNACIIYAGVPGGSAVENEDGTSRPSARNVQLVVHVQTLMESIDWWTVVDHCINVAAMECGVAYVLDIFGRAAAIQEIGAIEAVKHLGVGALLATIGKEEALRYFGVIEKPAEPPPPLKPAEAGKKEPK